MGAVATMLRSAFICNGVNRPSRIPVVKAACGKGEETMENRTGAIRPAQDDQAPREEKQPDRTVPGTFLLSLDEACRNAAFMDGYQENMRMIVRPLVP
jgi:hypothetical protein